MAKQFTVTVASDTENYTEMYDDLIDAANVFAIECGGEEIINSPFDFHCVGDGEEVAWDLARFQQGHGIGSIIVAVPECNYRAELKGDA